MDQDDETHEINSYCRYECKHGFIGSWVHLPEGMIDNEFLLTGYRIGFKGFTNGLRTLFILHNETVNIWSHLLGKLLFVGFLIGVAMVYP